MYEPGLNRTRRAMLPEMHQRNEQGYCRVCGYGQGLWPCDAMLLFEENGAMLEALDLLGVALADHGHQWTEAERTAYEKATKAAAFVAVEGASIVLSEEPC